MTGKRSLLGSLRCGSLSPRFTVCFAQLSPLGVLDRSSPRPPVRGPPPGSAPPGPAPGPGSLISGCSGYCMPADLC